MKQILQHLRTGEMELAGASCPLATPGQVLIQTRASLISAGIERMLVEFSQANLLQKTRQQPDKVRQVLDKIQTDGLLPTLEAVCPGYTEARQSSIISVEAKFQKMIVDFRRGGDWEC